jgi:TolA-binding protein
MSAYFSSPAIGLFFLSISSATLPLVLPVLATSSWEENEGMEAAQKDVIAPLQIENERLRKEIRQLRMLLEFKKRGDQKLQLQSQPQDRINQGAYNNSGLKKISGAERNPPDQSRASEDDRDEDALFNEEFDDSHGGVYTKAHSGSDHKLLSIDAVIRDFPQGWVVGRLPKSSTAAKPSMAPDSAANNPKSFTTSDGTPASNPPSTPPHLDSGLKYAKFFLKNQQFIKARQVFSRLVEKTSSAEYPLSMYWLGILDLYENRLPEASKWFKKTYEHCAKSKKTETQKLCVAALLRLTTALLRDKQLEPASIVFAQCQERAQPIQGILAPHIQSDISAMAVLLKQLRILKSGANSGNGSRAQPMSNASKKPHRQPGINAVDSGEESSYRDGSEGKKIPTVSNAREGSSAQPMSSKKPHRQPGANAGSFKQESSEDDAFSNES